VVRRKKTFGEETNVCCGASLIRNKVRRREQWRWIEMVFVNRRKEE
jgi:hypothetical protein